MVRNKRQRKHAEKKKRELAQLKADNARLRNENDCIRTEY